ncbi:MAG: putative manganese-dependent inorganic diphosphatase [Clostridiales bacterium]|nr:putative manganese-dependent inorganic diphosphatase [Candidatus Crickella equi]
MSKIYITGHKNPDLDTICAACSYAKLKNQIDPDNEYIPVHCSPISDTVKKQLENFNLPIPAFKKDIIPRVGDVMLTQHGNFQVDEPIYSLIQAHEQHAPSVMPLFEGEEFKTLLTMDDITAWFLRDSQGEDPVYTFPVKNVAKTIPGELIQASEAEEIEGIMLAGAATPEAFNAFLEKNDKCIVFMGERSCNLDTAIKKQVPAIIVTTIADGEQVDYDFTGYKGLVYRTPLATAEAIRRMRLVEPVSSIVRFTPDFVQVDDFFEDARDAFSKTKARGMAVMDGDEFVGYVTRRCFLKAPTENVIMVDHNEAEQSILGIEKANIKEIIDHHRLAPLTTELPIFIAAEPLGSTCTIVLSLYRKYGITPDEEAAKYMLTGLLSDTLILKSPTTTPVDEQAAADLAKLGNIEDFRTFGKEMFSVVESLATQDPMEKSQADFKKYENGGLKMGIAQCEVMTLTDIGLYSEKYIEALEKIREEQNLDWVMLMITDVLMENSVLLVTEHKMNKELPYKKWESQIYMMPGVMSRKKQLLPAILAVTGN